jgi:hypothetical protein
MPKLRLSFMVVIFFLLTSIKPAFSQTINIWANEGGDKVAREEMRATANSSAVINSVWNGTSINLFAARNEVVAAYLVLEAPSGAQNVSVTLPELNGPGGVKLSSRSSVGDEVFSWTGREIELFYVRYLQIKGLSRTGYEWYYDERHVPERFRRPYTERGIAVPGTGWLDRTDHDRFYPDIAVPQELVPQWNIAANTNQGIWIDIYIPKSSPPGLYQGTLQIKVAGNSIRMVPVQLVVHKLTLPDIPSSKSMVYLEERNINMRFVGRRDVNPSDVEFPYSSFVRDQFFKLAHRHKISLIDNNLFSGLDQPVPEWIPRLSGFLFMPINGYEGPGENTGNNVFSIGSYGAWQTNWSGDDPFAMQFHTQAWENWFSQHFPGTERFIYLSDESSDFVRTERLAQNSRVNSFATAPLPLAVTQMPSLKIIASTIFVGITEQWENALAIWKQDPSHKFYMYNGHRPASGTFLTEDDGVSPRQVPWAQYKKGIDRWYIWESTYYNDTAWGTGETPLFDQAKTFGADGTPHFELGLTSSQYSNGDGVLFYPGTDRVFPSQSYGVDGPFASLRLKLWRRGIQDVDYLTFAAQLNPALTKQIVDQMIPKVLWEYGVAEPSDPTYQYTDISWSTNPDVWENARAELACIIDSAIPTRPGDFDLNGKVDDNDYLVWRSTFGNSVPPGAGADGGGNGIIDAADYIIWKKNLGSPTPGDFDSDGDVDNNDYLIWRSTFGNTVTPGTGADGSGNGIVDSADYIIWRKNLIPLPGDFNSDGVVDNNDYLVWRSTFGNTVAYGTGADVSCNGVVDSADYIIWRKHSQTITATNAESQAQLTVVPTPTIVPQVTSTTLPTPTIILQSTPTTLPIPAIVSQITPLNILSPTIAPQTTPTSLNKKSPIVRNKKPKQ